MSPLGQRKSGLIRQVTS